MSRLSEEDRTNLVALLDGELDDQAAQLLEAKLSRDLENHRTCDSPKRTRANRRSENLPALDDKNVVSRALGHISGFV